MKKILLALLCAATLYACNQPQQAQEAKTETTAVDTTPKAVEMGDPAGIETGKSMLAAFTEGNMDKYLANFADDAKYYWNNGDSLIGKAAISEFWKKRRSEVVKTATYDNQIWLPVKINQPQSTEMPGNWLLGWARVSITYKNDKSMTQWMHWTIHFNDNNQIDQMNHFVDMEPINAALAPRK